MVKRGSKAHPLCTFCKKDGHYSSTCPLLAQKCLKALSGHNLKSLEKHVAEGKKLYVSGLPGKSQRTLKSASGKRSWNEVSKVGGTKKVRKAESKKEHAKKDGIRRPRPKSIRDQQPVFNAKCTRSAYRKLVSAGWIKTHKRCVCGQPYVSVPWATGQGRGRGRLWVRCYRCNSFKLAFCRQSFFFSTYVGKRNVCLATWHSRTRLERCAEFLLLTGDANAFVPRLARSGSLVCHHEASFFVGPWTEIGLQ